MLNELEREYREHWQCYLPLRCREFMAMVADKRQAEELLIRLLCIDLELFRTVARGSTQSTVEDEERAKPCLSLFLIQFPELRDNPAGLERLVMLEFALRVQHDGEQPNIDSYVDFCPSTRLLKNLEEAQARLQELKYTVLEEPPSQHPVEKSKSTVPQAGIEDSFTAPSVPFTLGRFLLIRYIGRGGMGFVYAAIDLSCTAQVAIKMMRRGDGWSVFRFVEEFHWLSQLNHPNLVRLYDAYAEGDARYFSMELVDGNDIRQWYRDLKQDAADHLPTLVRSMGQLASAIHFLHSHGVIHRDIKCSNVMITARGRTVLLDLGLAIRETDQNATERPMEGDAMPGTFVYMSPEAYNNQKLGPSSDWYSFGVTLFELLVGDVPQIDVEQRDSEGNSSRNFAYQPEQLYEQLKDVPNDLATLCVSLLNPNPARRPTGSSVLETLQFDADLKPQIIDSKCYGRDAELSQLKRISSDCAQSTQSRALIAISGDAGMGKSLLLETWLNSIDTPELRVLSVNSYRQDHTPYRLWNQIVQELVRLWGQLPLELGDILRPRTQVIGRSFPQFLQLDNSISSVRAPASELANLLQASIESLLEVICELSAKIPVIIAIDNAQWADEVSMSGITQLLTAKYAFRGLVVLVSDSIEKIGPSLKFSEIVADMVHLNLLPLSRETSQQMLADWCEQTSLSLSQSETKRLVSLSKGCPFLLRELYRSAVDQQLVTSDYQSAELDMTKLVNRRFARIPRQAEKALQFLAVADQPLYFQQLISTCRLNPRELQASLNVLAHQGWIRVHLNSTDTTAEIASESFRDAIVDSMQTDRLYRRHFRLAKTLSVEIDPPWSRIAFHYEEARNFRLAATCHIEAARDAFRKGAFRDALYFVDKGMHPAARRSNADQLRLDLMKATCLSSLGRSEEATELLSKLAEQEDDLTLAIELRFCAGEEMIRAGRLSDGLRLMKSGFRQINASTGQHSMYLYIRNGLSAWWLARSPLESNLTNFNTTEDDSRKFINLNDHLLSSTLPLWFLDHDQANSLIARLVAFLRSQGTYAQRTQCTLLSGLLLAFYGRRYVEGANRRFVVGRRMASRQQSQSGKIANSIVQMLWCLHRGSMRKMYQHARRVNSITISGRLWEQAFVQWNSLYCLWFDGRFAELFAEVKSLRERFDRCQQPMLGFWSNSFPSIQADLVTGNIQRAEQAIESSKHLVQSEVLVQPTFYHWLTQVNVALYQGNVDLAQSTIQEQWKWVAQSGLLGLGFFAMMAYGARINANLLRLRNRQEDRWIITEIHQDIAQLRQLPYRSFHWIAMAYQLIVDAHGNGSIDRSQWQAVKAALARSGLSLYAQALQWHESLYAGTSDLPENIIDSLCKQGCAEPSRLMNLILPLPAANA